jgi:hypothetical protein
MSMNDYINSQQTKGVLPSPEEVEDWTKNDPRFDKPSLRHALLWRFAILGKSAEFGRFRDGSRVRFASTSECR